MKHFSKHLTHRHPGVWARSVSVPRARTNGSCRLMTLQRYHCVYSIQVNGTPSWLLEHQSLNHPALTISIQGSSCIPLTNAHNVPCTAVRERQRCIAHMCVISAWALVRVLLVRAHLGTHPSIHPTSYVRQSQQITKASCLQSCTHDQISA